MSFILTIRKSCGPLPCLAEVSVASLMCSPVAHAFHRLAEALSTRCMKWRSEKLTFPVPPPPPWDIEPGLDAPQLQLSTSISSLCLSSVDSPLISPSLK